MRHDGLDLHERVHRQLGNLDHGAGRHVGHGAGDARIGEEARVHFVHGIDVGEVLQEDGDLHDVIERDVDAREDSLDVLEALSGLLGDAADHDLVRHGVDGELSRDVVVVRERHGLRKTVVLRGLVRVTSQYYVISH